MEVGRLSINVQAPAREFDADLYLPAGCGKAPLVIVAHGFMRSRALQSPCRSYLPGPITPATGEPSVS